MPGIGFPELIVLVAIILIALVTAVVGIGCAGCAVPLGLAILLTIGSLVTFASSVFAGPAVDQSLPRGAETTQTAPSP
jgi:hypothetical protein